jgi:hypothetical protein
MIDGNHWGRRVSQIWRHRLRKAVALRHRLPWAGESSLQKYDIINALARKKGYRAYLEICTAQTGGRFRCIAKRQFEVCHRLMYRCPQDFADGEKITFRSTGESLDGLIDPTSRYDIILIDPWHSFEASLQALELGFSLLREGGVMVVHDCSPPRQEITTPQFRPGPWCGVTYLAYLEFVFSNGLRYCTVDTDYGCGVIRKDKELKPTMESGRLREQWPGLYESKDPFPFFSRYRQQLLNLVSAEEFLLTEDLRAPLPVRCSKVFRRITQSASRILRGGPVQSGDLNGATDV